VLLYKNNREIIRFGVYTTLIRMFSFVRKGIFLPYLSSQIEDYFVTQIYQNVDVQK